MARLYRRHTAEIAPVRNPGLRLLPAMLVGVAITAGIAWFALGLRTRSADALPDVVIQIQGDDLVMPDGTLCPVARHGCDTALSRLPPARLRVVGPHDAMFALAVPALEVAAKAHREVLLDAGSGPVAVEPMISPEMKAWSTLDPDAPGLRLRVIMRSDGFWVGSAAGKVLGADPRGPTLLPTSAGQDYQGLARKLRAVKNEIRDTENACALLPALDLPLYDVVRAAIAMHGPFEKVLLAVP